MTLKLSKYQMMIALYGSFSFIMIIAIIFLIVMMTFLG